MAFCTWWPSTSDHTLSFCIGCSLWSVDLLEEEDIWLAASSHWAGRETNSYIIISVFQLLLPCSSAKGHASSKMHLTGASSKVQGGQQVCGGDTWFQVNTSCCVWASGWGFENWTWGSYSWHQSITRGSCQGPRGSSNPTTFADQCHYKWISIFPCRKQGKLCFGISSLWPQQKSAVALLPGPMYTHFLDGRIYKWHGEQWQLGSTNSQFVLKSGSNSHYPCWVCIGT